VVNYTKDTKTPSNSGQAIVALNIGGFADVQTFKQKVDDVWDMMKSSPTLPGFDEVRLPGERSGKLYEDRIANGVPLGSELGKVLDELADRLKIQRLS
jgi:LDH2 family malate/lactate/ureidoglycolate dehydrogenase